MATDPGERRRTVHSAVDRVLTALAQAGVDVDPVTLEDSASTAALAAQALGVDQAQIVRSLVFASDDGPLLVLSSGAHQVDTAKLAAAAGVTGVRRADADYVKEHTGQSIGGVAPVGHPHPIRTVIDPWLQQHETIWAAAGHSHTVFASSFDQLQQVTGAVVADIGQ